MTKLVAQLRAFARDNNVNLWIVVLAVSLNILAWVVPDGNIRMPARDPLQAAALAADLFRVDQHLLWFWNGVLAVFSVTSLLAIYELMCAAIAQMNEDAE